MTFKNGKQLSTRLLIMYMISALLFLTSIELHIHAGENAVSAEQGGAVHISSVAAGLVSPDQADEISISPNGALKVSQNNFSVLAVFLLATLIAVFCHYACVLRIRDFKTLFPQIPFHGTPLLRAPPAINS